MAPVGSLIASSVSAEIFAFGDGRILKLYRAGAPRIVAEREAIYTRTARNAGLPVPAVLDVVGVEDRFGLVLERAMGPTMLEVLAAHPDRGPALARDLAALHASVHAKTAPSLPGLIDRCRERIVAGRHLRDDQRAAALAAIDRLDDDERLCHGDFHPGNIVVAERGLVILDWFDATRGDPAADLARTWLILTHASIPKPLADDTRAAIAGARAAFCAEYVSHVGALQPAARDRLERWKLPVAAARLAEPVSAAEAQALERLVDELRAPR